MATKYWVGGSGTWDSLDTTHWANSSGGAGGTSTPIYTDTVIFDNNSGTAGTTVVVSIYNSGGGGTGTATCAIFDTSACTAVTALKFDAANTVTSDPRLEIWRSSNLSSKTSIGTVAGAYYYNLIFYQQNNTTCTLATNGAVIYDLYLSSVGLNDTVTLLSDLTITNRLFLSYGTLNANGYNVTVSEVYNVFAVGNSYIYMGSGTWTVKGDWSTFYNTCTIVAGTSTLILQTDTYLVFYPKSGSTFYNITAKLGKTLFGGVDPTVLIRTNITCSTFDAITQNTYGPDKINFGSNTLTVTSSFIPTTTGRRVIYIEDGTVAKASGVVATNNLNILNNTATGGAQFFAGNLSTNAGGNSGWQFGGGLFVLFM